MPNPKNPEGENLEERLTKNTKELKGVGGFKIFGKLCDEGGELTPKQREAMDRVVDLLIREYPGLTIQETLNILVDAQKRILHASQALQVGLFSNQ